MLKRWLAALVVAVASLAAPAHADVPVPALKARVTDLTGTLSAEQAAALEQRLAAFEAKKGSQIAVLMLPSTKPEEIEQYSIRVAEAWKIGRKGTDDGVILVVAKDDRRLRIEVGYGLEGAIPDATAKRVISETITPRFKAGDFYGGISAGVDQLIQLVDGEKLPPPSGTAQGQGGMDPSDFIVPGIIFVVVVGSILKAVLGRFPGAVASGALAGVVAWFLFGLGIAAIAAFIAFILTLMNSGNWSSGGGGFSSGGSSGGSSSWGGGGGSFGGGGSSGSW
ncbi:MAG: YgcG family protein [Proteobacteria bacterium]|nr:YgcG family protein [Pseudomonadota bacterium]